MTNTPSDIIIVDIGDYIIAGQVDNISIFKVEKVKNCARTKLSVRCIFPKYTKDILAITINPKVVKVLKPHEAEMIRILYE